MSTTTLPVIRLQSCPKGYTRDLDKTISPQETYERVQARMQAAGLDILAEVRRVDVGRLGIPVYLSVCGRDARGIMPTRKQMGKGSSPEQARASALMELMERFAFFSFWQRLPHMVSATWAEAEERFGKDLLPIEEICRSVDDSLSPEQAREAMSTLRWNFFPATHLADGRIVWLPLDWFKLLGEFNGTSAGNSPEESLLQGLSELVDRHVCCRIDRERLTTPTIDPHEVDDPTLRDLLAAFEREGIHIVLKDFSLGMPLPTVGAVAWDPATFPARSEIVFTAGTGAYGGAIFVGIYLLCLFAVVPTMIMEFAVGRAARRNMGLAFHILEPKGSKWHWGGKVALIGSYLLMMFYTTVTGWMLYYCWYMGSGALSGLDAAGVGKFFGATLGDPVAQVVGMTLVVLMGCGVCAMGVQKGVERVVKLMMLGLLFILMALVIRSLTLPGAEAGVSF